MAQQLKAIETVYKGYRFRSRLEARWAVFFDAIELKYDYEPEGFDLNGLWYLPDFKLPGNIWAEIKPMGVELTEEAVEKARRLSLLGNCNVVILCGTPFIQNCRSEYNGMCLNAGQQFGWGWCWLDCLVCHTLSLSNQYKPGGYYCHSCSANPPSTLACQSAGVAFDGEWILYGPNQSSWHTPRLNAAYLQSRQARFARG